GSNRASRLRPTRCWPRSTAGSPRALTPLTSRRQGRCWRNWGHKSDVHSPLLILFAQICPETGKEQEVQVLYDEGLANHIGPEPCGVVSLQRAGKYQRPAWRPSQGQKGIAERALLASPQPSPPW